MSRPLHKHALDEIEQMLDIGPIRIDPAFGITDRTLTREDGYYELAVWLSGYRLYAVREESLLQLVLWLAFAGQNVDVAQDADHETALTIFEKIEPKDSKTNQQLAEE